MVAAREGEGAALAVAFPLFSSLLNEQTLLPTLSFVSSFVQASRRETASRKRERKRKKAKRPQSNHGKKKRNKLEVAPRSSVRCLPLK
jgi:hypothetical protein